MKSCASVTLDVDGLRCYADIHGVEVPESAHDAIYAEALPRFRSMLKKYDLRATLFVIARDLDDERNVDVLRGFVDDGHEIASHSYDHAYGLSRLSVDDITDELIRARDRLEYVLDTAVTGFRAPGYNMSETLAAAIDKAYIAYSSSIFPCPAYFAARGTALLRYRIARRASQSMLGNVREFMGPREPYHPMTGKIFRHSRHESTSRSYLEIPISTPRSFPWIGTSIALFPERITSLATAAVLKNPSPCVLELHGIDFAGASDGGIPATLVNAQPDLQVALPTKLERLEHVFAQLAESRRNIRLCDLALDYS